MKLAGKKNFGMKLKLESNFRDENDTFANFFLYKD